MKSARLNSLLAGTAIALALTIGSYANIAQAEPDAISAAVPMPDTAEVPPPTINDIAPPPAATPAPVVAPAAEAKPAAAAPAPTAEITHSVPEKTEDKSASVPEKAEDKSASVPDKSETKSATAAATSDTALTDKLRDELAAGKFDRALGGKKERTAVEAFYSSHNFAPLWIANGAFSDRGKAAIAYLAGVRADGLDPADYPTPQSAGTDADAQADAEIKLTDAVLTYAHHATSGRVHYTRVSADIIYDLPKIEPSEVLAKLAASTDVAATLNGFEPQNPYYQGLKAKLAELRRGEAPAAAASKADEKPVAMVHVPEGKILRPGMSDPRVVAVRKRLDIAGNKDNPLYDDAVSEAVKAFQTEANIGADGMLGPNTVRTMNGEKPAVRHASIDPEDVIIANMERWRWVPRDLGKSYVMVNIPDYSLRVVHDGKQIWKTKIVVGQPGKPTPLLSAEMKYITVNPTWNVPPSIIQNEYLPALQQDPQAMDRIGLKVEQNPDGTIRIYQPPGDRNALGRIRFNFPNKFLVYQHDTPDKYLFAKATRAYSHGCMRVENPLKYGEIVLGMVLPSEHYTAERLQKMFGGSEININFPKGLPDHLTYQTAFVDEDGKLQLRDDVYGRDRQLLAVLKGADRKVADIAIDRPKGSSTAPVKMPPGTFGSGGGGGGGGFFNGPSFFDRLFGGPEPAPKPRARVGRNTFER